MTKNNLYSQLSDNFEKLGLMQMKLHLDEIADDITSNKISITEGLLKLSNYEIDFKSQSAAEYYSREDKKFWLNQRIGSGGLKILEIYGAFPRKSDFTLS